MTIRNRALYTAMQTYTEAAFNVLLERFNNDVPVRVIYDEQWTWHEGMDMFVRGVQEIPLWNYYYHDARDVLHTLPEFQQALDALQKDAVISPQLGVAVGIDGIQQSFPAAHLPERFVLGVIGAQGGLAPLNREVFEREYAAMEDAYATDSVHMRIVAPIVGLMVDTAPLKLNNNFVIDALTMEEQSQFVHLGAMLGGDLARNVPCFGIRTGFTLAKVVGKQDDARRSADELAILQGFNTFATDMNFLMQALTAFKPGYCAWSDKINYLDWWFTSTPRRGTPPVTTQMTPTYRLDENEASQFLAFWQEVRNVDKSRTYIDTALRRLRYAAERERAEDRVLDLMIAAEALFLGMAGPNEKTEVRLRVSLYAASFLAQDRDERRAVFKEMRDAYDMRSTIAHGAGSVDAAKATVIADILDGHVRKGLRQVIQLALQQPVTNKTLVELDQLLFP